MSIWEGVVIMVIKNGAGANFVLNKYYILTVFFKKNINFMFTFQEELVFPFILVVL